MSDGWYRISMPITINDPTRRRPPRRIPTISLWDAVKMVLNEYYCENISRALLIDKLVLMGYRKSPSIDTYRNYLHKAGYLQKTDRRGTYLVVNEIEEDLSLADVRYIAYEKNKEYKISNINYKIVMPKFEKRRNEFIKESEFSVEI